MLFQIEVSDGFFPQTFKGEFEAKSKSAATKEAKEYYAAELGTTKNQIKVVSVKELKQKVI